MRGLEINCIGRGQHSTHNLQSDGHRDSMTDPAQKVESVKNINILTTAHTQLAARHKIYINCSSLDFELVLFPQHLHFHSVKLSALVLKCYVWCSTEHTMCIKVCSI